MHQPYYNQNNIEIQKLQCISENVLVKLLIIIVHVIVFKYGQQTKICLFSMSSRGNLVKI